jgi:two-component system copper resistance phosphate regulon response regulator CusR
MAVPERGLAAPAGTGGRVKILVVDDDPKVLSFVSRGLSESGMICATAPTGERALELLRREPFDLVLLDVMLPGIQGWDVLEKLRAEGNDVPVLFVTARDGVDERVRGLRGGGDDYIVKPFAFAELLARVHVALRRRRGRTVLTLGDLTVDLVAGKAHRGGKELPLTRTEFALLRYLAERPGETVSRAELLQGVWGYSFDPGTNLIEVHMRRLRAKVDEPFGKPLLHTVRGAGYACEARA